MKFKILKSELDKHISIAQKAISNKSSMQLLEGIVFSAKNNELILRSTDLELSIETRVECEVIEEGEIVINSTMIGNLIRKMPQDIITFTVDGLNINIKSQNSVFNITGQESTEYPITPEVEENVLLTIDNQDLRDAIKETIFATSTDETRLAFTGVLFEIKKDYVRFVGLDGYRMAMKTYELSANGENTSIVPKRAFNELVKILDDTTTDVIVIPGHIVFINGSTKMYSRLIDKKYIDYNRIIIKDYKTSVKLNRNDFINSLERALLLTTGNNASLTKLTFEDDMITINSNSEFGRLDEKIFVEKEGEDLLIAFNTRYMLDGLKAIEDDEIVLYLNSGLEPVNIYPVNDSNQYIYIVLPVRLSK